METKILAIRQMEYEGYPGEINTLPSETVQGQALTVQQVLERFSQGMMPDIGLEHYYDPDDYTFDDVDPLYGAFDLADAHEYERIIEESKEREKRLFDEINDNDELNDYPDDRKSSSKPPEAGEPKDNLSPTTESK